MKAAQGLIGLFRDSPTFGRDRANLISGFSIGTAGLLLNGAVLLLVLPLMLDTDDSSLRAITENVEFGQLLALILLGGATAFATLLIPLRLVTVLWGPRIGRYFDQIVLSGISPLRFVIGKATSQNLFLGLILFLLLPYLVLSLTLGGVNLSFFLAGLFLVWLYCMALALVTLWVSLYVNELLAALCVIAAGTFLGGLGCAPLPFQPFVLTPFPALIHPVYSSIPYFAGFIRADFFRVFLLCAASMTVVSGASLFAIYLGPLYGIIRENSAFGEVVRAGDSRRKRWLRFRQHIQRPSEIAFFYENRSGAFRRNEGVTRWGIAFCGMLLLSGVAYCAYLYLWSTLLAARGGTSIPSWAYGVHIMNHSVQGFALVLAIFVFSHAKNSTYLRFPFLGGRMVEVSRLDTTAFLLFMLLSTAASISIPFYVERFVAVPNGTTIWELPYVTRGRPVDFIRITLEGSVVISFAGLMLYAFHRLACLMTWVRGMAYVGTVGLYFFTICVLPLFVAMLFLEEPEFRRIQIIADWAPTLALVSPWTVLMFLFNEMGSRFPRDVSTAPFYVVHGLLLGSAIYEIRRRGRQLRELYLAEPTRETN